MKKSIRLDKKGLTLIELLVGLVICAMVVAGIYRLFIAQSKAYTVQDQVVEVQQNIRSAMEIMLRDLRMTGFDDDRTPLVSIAQPSIVPGDDSITVRYEYNNTACEVRYWLVGGTTLNRQETKNDGVNPPVSTTEAILENVQALNFSYGLDENDDGAMDDRDNNGKLDDWVSAATAGSLKVVSVRISLTARPTQTNPDLQSVTPRMLVSAITFRNLSLMR
jgi:prepilin-type N-terminal cleavage/methylation domain-containing protein